MFNPDVSRILLEICKRLEVIFQFIVTKKESRLILSNSTLEPIAATWLFYLLFFYETPQKT